MARQEYIFTSESVSEGHPDKVCDLISDSVLDAFVAKEPEARVAVETLTTTNKIVLAGEVRPTGLISAEEMANIARECVRNIGSWLGHCVPPRWNYKVAQSLSITALL